MRTWVNVARYHLTQPLIFVGMVWAIMAFSFAVNIVIFRLVPPSRPPAHYTGAVSIIYIFFFIMGVVATGRSLPFGLALGISRRSYYTGTALLAVALAAVDAVALTALQAIERGTNGWGEDLHFFRVPYLLDGPWYLTWLTSFVGLALLFAYGMWFGIVYRRWSIPGNVIFIAAQVTVLVAAALLISWLHGWTGVGHFFTALSAVGLTGLLAALTAALLAGGYATVRGVTV